MYSVYWYLEISVFHRKNGTKENEYQEPSITRFWCFVLFFKASNRNSDLTGTELAFSLRWGCPNQRQRPLRQLEPDRDFRRFYRQPSRTKRKTFQDRIDTLKRQLRDPKLCGSALQRRNAVCTHQSAARGCTPEAILSQECASFHATRRARGSEALKGAVNQL